MLSYRIDILGEYDKNNLHTPVNLNLSLRKERLDHSTSSMRRNGQQASNAIVSLSHAELSSQARDNRNLVQSTKLFPNSNNIKGGAVT
jgi:hypothetical protein